MRERPDPPRIDALIRWAAGEFARSPTPMIDARALAKAAFGLDDAMLIVEGSRSVDTAALNLFTSMVARRADDEPVAYIVGRREFWSLDIEVAPGILVPRADSETLIAAVIARRSRNDALRILDLGSGSGALLCALLSEFRDAQGLAIDVNPAAVALTARNLARLGLSDRALAREGCWFAGTSEVFDIIISNPPYIPDGDQPDLPAEVSRFESPQALFGGADGLAAYREIFQAAPRRLADEGLMALEIGAGQAHSVNALASAAFPNARIAVESDLAGRRRAVIVDLKPLAH